MPTKSVRSVKSFNIHSLARFIVYSIPFLWLIRTGSVGNLGLNKVMISVMNNINEGKTKLSLNKIIHKFMTEKEKALGYLQMLKAEGKLDEAALPELKKMYALSEEDAEELLASFKAMPEFSEITTSNIKSNSIFLLVLVMIASCFAFAAFANNGFEGFSIYFLLFALGALGSCFYVLQLLNEKYNLSKRYVWLQNKVLPFLIISVIFYCYTQYQLTYKTYMANPEEWVKLRNGVLTADCKEVSTGGKNPDYYYSIFIDDYFDPFKYDQKQHYYMFDGKDPTLLLKKGDTITLWVERNKIAELISSTKNKVWDIEIKGKRLLNINKRNDAAKQVAQKNRNFSLFFLVMSAIVFIYSGKKQNKEKMN